MTKRPYKFKLDSYRFYTLGMTPMESFARAGKTHQVDLSGCMTNKAYASGYMSDDIKNYIRKKIANNDLETIEYFNEHKLALDF